MSYKIYMIRNTVNDKVYVGQTVRGLEERFNSHLQRSSSEESHFYSAIRKYGRDKFFIELLEETETLEAAYQLEKDYIEKYNTYKQGYNSTLGGEGRPTVDVSDEEIIELYLKLKSSDKVARHLNIGSNTVLRVLHSHDIPLFGSGWEASDRISPLDVEVIYKETRSLADTAKQLGIAPSTVKSKLEEIGAEIYEFGFSLEEELSIVDKYRNSKLSLSQLGETLGINRKILSRILNKHNVEIDNMRGRNQRAVIAIIDEEQFEFPTVTACAQFLIKKNIPKSTKVKTVTEGINRSVRVNVPYYGVSFIKS